MKETVAWWALLFSIGSFALYLTTALVQVLAQRKADSAVQATVASSNVTSLLTVIKDLAEVLSKASPSLVALIASIAYLAMAGLAAGAFGTE